MKYSVPEIKIAEFEAIYASGDIPANATGSEIGYDVSVSYAEIQSTTAVQGAKVVF